MRRTTVLGLCSIFATIPLLALLLSACAATHYRNVVRPDAGQLEFDQDLYACQQESRGTTSNSMAVKGFAFSNSDVEVDSSLVRQCLAARGWREASTSPPPPVPTMNAPTTPQAQAGLQQVQEEIRTAAQKALSGYITYIPSPHNCDMGFVTSDDGYVTEVASWAEQAGLHLGDKIYAVRGSMVRSLEEIVQAYGRVPQGGPLTLVVTRQEQYIGLSLPCRYQPEGWNAYKRMLEAASHGDWDGCIRVAREVRRLSDVAVPNAVWWEWKCARAKVSSMASPEAGNWAALYYEVTRSWLRESRYVPGKTEKVRGEVLRAADDLRKSGFPAYADDLEAQLREALAKPLTGH